MGGLMTDKHSYFDIKKPQNTCTICGALLPNEGHHPSALTELYPEPIRKDYCLPCWKQLKDKQFFSFWLTKRIALPTAQKADRQQRNEMLLRLFMALYTHQDPAHATQLYLLAHLLMKYKVFKWVEMRKSQEGEDSLVFEHTRTGEEIYIAPVATSDEEVAQAKKAIDTYLEEGFSNSP
jgi:hypothetical protein